MSQRPLEAIILAAGKGTRMNSDLPKVLHEVGGRPMVHWVADACRQAGARRLVLVVGYRSDLVRASFADADDVTFVEQTEQLGTGHAAKMAEPAFEGVDDCDVFVIAGDMPMFRGSTLRKLAERHRASGARASVATGELDDPTGYGRVIRDGDGRFEAIVEHKDADEAQRAVREVNISCYCFDVRTLFDALANLRTDNVQGEYYITDVPAQLKGRGEAVEVINIVPADEVEGINTAEQLAAVDRKLRQREQDEVSAS